MTVTKCEDLRSEKHGLKLSLDTAKAKLDELSIVRDSTAGREQAMSKDNAALHEQLKAKASECRDLEAELTVVRRNLTEFESRRQAFVAKTDELAAACDRLEKRCRQLEQDKSDAIKLAKDEHADKDRIIAIHNTETSHFQQAMAYFRDELTEIAESQQQHELLTQEFTEDSLELRKQVRSERALKDRRERQQTADDDD
jgi:hypothetical protein